MAKVSLATVQRTIEQYPVPLIPRCSKQKEGQIELMKILEEVIINSVWSVAQVSDQPEITLVRWSVMEAQTTGQRRFVGFNVEDCEGRVSSAIQSFDPTTGRGVTRSGRIYQLDGPPGHDPDGDWVWSQVRSGDNWRDVSADLQAAILAAHK